MEILNKEGKMKKNKGKKKNYSLLINTLLVVCWLIVFFQGIDPENRFADPLYYIFILIPIILLTVSIVSIRSKIKYSSLFLIFSMLMILFSMFFLL